MTLLDAALAFEAAGMSVVPARPDQSKAPLGAWKKYQDARAAPDEVRAWFANGAYDGFGVICGAISGELELLECEGRATGAMGELKALADASGLGDLWARVTTGYLEVTPGAGFHILYRLTDAAVPGNLKLAKDADGLVLAETRGLGGFCIVAPSGGRTHPSGGSWTLLQGGPGTIAGITGDEREALHALFRTLDRTPEPPEPLQRPAPGVNGDGSLQPGDDFNARATWRSILPAGWVAVYTNSAGVTFWRRPDKQQGISATTGRNDGDNLYVFSSSTVFEQEKPYSKFGALALLQFGGDFSAAASWLRGQGYGAPQQAGNGDIRDLIAHQEGTTWSSGTDSGVTSSTASPSATADASTASPATGSSDGPAVPETDEQAPKRLRHGGAFILDAPENVPTIWGDHDDVIWARGEALMVVGPPGVGKTTLVGQVLRARLGLGGDVLGMPVETTGSRVLYLAMDRPQQIARALRRTFKAHERATLDDRLRVWEGPPPADIAKRPEILVGLADLAGADTIIVDSLKDAAIGLGEDEVAGGYNRARQMCLAAGVEVVELHHLVKRGPNGVKPNTLADVYGSTWLTAGAGSVLLLWGQAGDPIVELGHLKQPAGEVGPWRVIHDHRLGTSTIWHETDPLAVLKLAGGAGITVKALACSTIGADKPSTNDIEKARRKLEKLAEDGYAERREPPAGSTGTAAQVTYHATTHALTGALTDLIEPAGVTAVTNHSRENTNPQVRALTDPLTAVTDQSTHARPPLSIRGGGAVPPPEEHFCRSCGQEIPESTATNNRGYCWECS